MKREILCPDCKKELRKTFPSDTPYPGEHVKFVEGKALNEYVCDQCDKEIHIGDPCFAFSSWADYGGIPYYEWEGEFIQAQNTETNSFNENSPMPIGKFKGQPMKDVPDWHLKWLKANANKATRRLNRELFEYIYHKIAD